MNTLVVAVERLDLAPQKTDERWNQLIEQLTQEHKTGHTKGDPQ